MPYNPNFIPGVNVALPTLTAAVQQQAFNGGTPIDHTNFSTVFNQVRGFAVYSAHNIDGENFLDDGPDSHGFTFDPQVKPNSLQVDNDRGYRGVPTQDDNPWDRGHLARRRALHWPDFATADEADRESSHYTNITPQHRGMNRQGGAWANVENFILELADNDTSRACVFTGPVFTQSDHVLVNITGELAIQIPAGHWKVAVVRHNGELRTAAFVLWQCDLEICQPITLDPVLEQVRLNTVEYLAGLFFNEDVREADTIRLRGPNAVCAIENGADIII